VFVGDLSAAVAKRYFGCGVASTPDGSPSCRRARLLRGRSSRTDPCSRTADGRLRDPARARSASPTRRLLASAPAPTQKRLV